MGVMCVSFGVDAQQGESWQEVSCNPDAVSCREVSSDYAVPYCVSLNAPVADYSLDCIWASVTNALSSVPARDDGQGNKTQSLPLGKFETRNLIEQYCKALLWNWNMWRVYYAVPSNVNEGWDWQQTFDSHQSIFVNALCSSFKDKDGKTPFVDEFYLGEVFSTDNLVRTLKLQQRSWWKDLCSLVDYEYLNDCDLSVYATEIYSAIMSDIFKIKYAQVLHVDDAKNFDSQEKVKAFMSGYFNLSEPNWDYRRLKDTFPQTIFLLESNQKYYKAILGSLKIIDNPWLATREAVTKLKCPIDWNMTLVDFIACALHSSQWKWFSLTPSFITFVYNEIMNYRIFQLYINTWIEERTKELSDEKDIRRVLSKSLDFQWYVNVQIEATKQALLRFEDFNMTYPLHIWLLLYQESMKNFRDYRLSPIVTIFYSLSERLQNVQLPNS